MHTLSTIATLLSMAYLDTIGKTLSSFASNVQPNALLITNTHGYEPTMRFIIPRFILAMLEWINPVHIAQLYDSFTDVR